MACANPNVVPPTSTSQVAVTAAPTATLQPVPTPGPESVLRTAEVGGWEQADPHRAPTPASFYHFFGNVYGGLVRWATDNVASHAVRRVIPDLAERWEQPDAQTYLFHLRPSARWHDMPPANGRPLTAQDVVFNIERLRASHHRHPWEMVTSVEALDEDTVRIRLTEPNAGFLGQLADGVNVFVLPEAVLASPQGDLHDGPVIGTGPLLFDALASHRQTRGVFTPNEAFYDDRTPDFDRLERLVVDSEDTGLVFLRTGRIDFLELSSSGATKLIASPVPGVDLLSRPRLSAWALTFKPRPPFDRSEARRAASLAIDRPALWQTYTGSDLPVAVGLGMPAPGADVLPTPDETMEPYRRDPAEARRLLEGLGAAASTPFSVTVGDFGPGDARQAGAELVQQLRDAGFTADMRLVSADVYASTVAVPPGLFHVSFGPVASPPEADWWLSARYGAGGDLNVIGPPGGRLPELIAAQHAEVDPLKRAALLREAQRFLQDQAYQPSVFLEQGWTAVRETVTGWPSFFDDAPYQRFIRGVGLMP